MRVWIRTVSSRRCLPTQIIEDGRIMDNGVSKKFCAVLIGVQAIITMSQDAAEKFKYALLVAGLVVFYKTLQFLIDRKKP